MRPVAIILAALALAPTVALAQSSVPEQVDGRPVTYRPVEEHTFGEVDVNATTSGPALKLAVEHTPGQHKQLIVLRANFNPEMDQSAEQIR